MGCSRYRCDQSEKPRTGFCLYLISGIDFRVWWIQGCWRAARALDLALGLWHLGHSRSSLCLANLLHVGLQPPQGREEGNSCP